MMHNTELLNLLTLHLPDMLWVKDKEGNYIYVNKAICDNLLMAKDVNEPIGKNDGFFIKREQEKYKEKSDWYTFGQSCLSSDEEVMQQNRAMKFEETGYIKGKLVTLEVYKAPFYDNAGNIIGTIGAGRDITQMKKTENDLKSSLKILEQQREQLEYQTYHDSLTGLPNRILCVDRLEQSIELAQTTQEELAILIIDLDHFKEINDSSGHDFGDKVLIEFASRLKTLIVRSDTLSRLGGDEFCVILHDIQNIQSTSSFIVKTQELLKEPFLINDKNIYVSMSIGVALYPYDGMTPKELLKNADAAMYRAKENGRGSYAFYDEAMTQKAVNRVYFEMQLRKALKEDELVVFFQPQMNSKENKLVGMEALVRWQHKEMGMIFPDKFIPIAELTGLIVELDRIVMKKALHQFKLWRDAGLNPGKLAMNVAMKQLECADFVDFMKELVLLDDSAYDNIELEVTESAIMKNPEQSIKVLQELHDLGIDIAIDDFGTGYSSLAYLKRLPISKLKIDKSFIDELPHDLEDVAISKTIINLCKSLNLKVIAEGVETKEQKDFLLENGCHFVQGYFYSRPLSVSDMEIFLRKDTSYL